MSEYACVFCGQNMNPTSEELTQLQKQEIARQHMMVCDDHPFAKLVQSTFSHYQKEADKAAIYRKAVDDLLDPLSVAIAVAEEYDTKFGPGVAGAWDDTKDSLRRVRAILRLFYSTLGLCGETGEVANKVKKLLRDGSIAKLCELIPELGDSQWYVAAVATELEYPLESIARENLAKLASRLDKGTVQGSGDHR